MIGQEKLQIRLSELLTSNHFSPFIIIVGPVGSGKKTLIRNVVKPLFKGLCIESGIKIDEIRNLINNMYKVNTASCYIIPDADNMSNAAKSALLKLTEEPPNNAFIIMTLEDLNNTFDTIRSRATVFYMDRYTAGDLVEYANLQDPTELELATIRNVCETPGDVDNLKKYGICQFRDYVELVFNNIGEVSIANSFKIADKIALKEGSDGYNLKLFWKVFISIVFDNINEYKYLAPLVNITSSYMADLRVRGLNKQMLFDNWIIDIREVLNGN